MSELWFNSVFLFSEKMQNLKCYLKFISSSNCIFIEGKMFLSPTFLNELQSECCCTLL